MEYFFLNIKHAKRGILQPSREQKCARACPPIGGVLEEELPEGGANNLKTIPLWDQSATNVIKTMGTVSSARVSQAVVQELGRKPDREKTEGNSFGEPASGLP